MRWPRRDARSGLALLPLVVGAGAVLGLLEGGYHVFGPRPPRGVPGFEGPDLLAYAALGAVSFAVPAMIAALLAPAGRRDPVVWVSLAAVLPTAFGFFDHLVHSRNWAYFALHTGGWPHLVRIGAVALAASGLAVLLAVRPGRRWLQRLQSSPRRSASAGAGVALTAAAVGLLWLRLPAHEVQDKPPRPQSPNVLLLTIDTLRQDAVGAYGGSSTPALDGLLERGVRADGWAPSPWTRPSMAALLGHLPVTATAATGESPVYPGVPWWPQRLQEAGYVTQAIVCNPHLAARFGFDRGFDGFEHAGELERLAPIGQSVWSRWLTRQIRGRHEPSRGDRLADRSERWLQGAASLQAPWLLWVHLLDPHLPYHLRGSGGEAVDPDPPVWVADLEGELDGGVFTDLEGARTGRRVVTRSAREALHRLYLREVAYADHHAGRIVRAAQEASGERALVWILTSDHGEEFFEHGGFEHGHAMHGEILRVPLALGGLDLPAGAQIGGMKLQDVGPTLLSLLGLTPPAGDEGAGLVEADSVLVPFVVGIDRSSQLRAARPAPAGCAPPAMIAEGMLYGPPRTRVLWPQGTSLWLDDESGRVLLSDVCLDPQETSARSVEVADEAHRRLLQQLSAWRLRLTDRLTEVGIDADLRQQLKALGYVE